MTPRPPAAGRARAAGRLASLAFLALVAGSAPVVGERLGVDDIEVVMSPTEDVDEAVLATMVAHRVERIAAGELLDDRSLWTHTDALLQRWRICASPDGPCGVFDSLWVEATNRTYAFHIEHGLGQPRPTFPSEWTWVLFVPFTTSFADRIAACTPPSLGTALTTLTALYSISDGLDTPEIRIRALEALASARRHLIEMGADEPYRRDALAPFVKQFQFVTFNWSRACSFMCMSYKEATGEWPELPNSARAADLIEALGPHWKPEEIGGDWEREQEFLQVWPLEPRGSGLSFIRFGLIDAGP